MKHKYGNMHETWFCGIKRVTSFQELLIVTDKPTLNPFGVFCHTLCGHPFKECFNSSTLKCRIFKKI
jgi:hypothetical protein